MTETETAKNFSFDLKLTCTEPLDAERDQDDLHPDEAGSVPAIAPDSFQPCDPTSSVGVRDCLWESD